MGIKVKIRERKDGIRINMEFSRQEFLDVRELINVAGPILMDSNMKRKSYELACRIKDTRNTFENTYHELINKLMKG